MYKSGKARAIGVSNYSTAHVQELLAAADVKPMVNQVG
jgi:diketogulonate reductase-like aldo/keto reductase